MKRSGNSKPGKDTGSSLGIDKRAERGCQRTNGLSQHISAFNNTDKVSCIVLFLADQ